MKPFTFVLTGNSGCGKGTQGKLLGKYLEEKFSDNPVFYLETGGRFRKFLSEPGYSNDLARKIYEAGERQPDFLGIWNWSHILIESMIGKEHLIVDGAPRAYSEALAFETAMKFYGRNLVVIYINVSRAWAKERLMGRGRVDDVNTQRLEHRLDWFEKDVIPAIEYFRTNPECRFVEVNGEQTIEEVNAEMMEKLNIRTNE